MNTHNSITPSGPGTGSSLLLSACFNQDQGCFAIGHEHGFRVYNSDPMDLRVKREFLDGGIGTATMLHRTNYLALVGGGRNPKFPQNKVIIWDDLKHRPALSIEFLSPVLKVLLSRTRVVAILRNKVQVYAFSSEPTRIAAYDTVDNPHGLGALSNNILAVPGRGPGQLQIVNLATATSGADDASGEARQLVSIVRAHQGNIRCIALNASGSVVATASETGTVVRLYSTENTALLHEFRRGLDKAIVYSMAFSQSANRLAVLSDKNTLHVFDTSIIADSKLSSGAAGPTVSNRRHVLRKVPLMPRYFSSEWSFASARVEGHQEGVLGWSSEDSIIVVWIKSCRWEKYVIVETEHSVHSPSHDQQRGGTPDSVTSQWELVREAWRGFDGLTYE